MSCVSLLRRIGLLPRVTESEFSAAVAENALADNTKAFTDMKTVMQKYPDTNKELLALIKKSSSPFADLELMMQNKDANQKRRRAVQ